MSQVQEDASGFIKEMHIAGALESMEAEVFTLLPYNQLPWTNAYL